MMMRQGAISVIGALLLLTSCAAPPETALPTQPLVPSTATLTPLPLTATVTQQPLPGPADVAATNAPVVAIPARAQALVGLVMADLAQALSITDDAILLQSVEAVVWPDAGLGCIGEATPEVQAGGTGVEGYRIVLQYQGRVYDYHTDTGRRFRLCQDTRAVQGEPIILDPILDALIDLARRDLAERLDLPQRRVFLVEVMPYEWPDTSLGCPLAGQEILPDPTAGYRIVLRVGQQNYIYHSNTVRVFQCPPEAEVLPAVGPFPALMETPAASDTQ